MPASAIADCHADAGPGACNAAPKNGSGNATSKINVLDLTRTYNVKIFGMSIYDHFSGDFGVSVGNGATFRDDNFAREITDGTSPIPSTPTGSSCLTMNAGQCNYGALPFVGQREHAAEGRRSSNDVVTGTDAQLLRVTARGSISIVLWWCSAPGLTNAPWSPLGHSMPSTSRAASVPAPPPMATPSRTMGSSRSPTH